MAIDIKLVLKIIKRLEVKKSIIEGNRKWLTHIIP
jgi:hypothetical protein